MNESHSELLKTLLAEVSRIGSILEGLENDKKKPTHSSGGVNSSPDRESAVSFSDVTGSLIPPPLERGSFVYSRDLLPSDYVDMIAEKIRGVRVKDGNVVWVPGIETANSAARHFLKKHGHATMMSVCRFIIANGHVSVGEAMFENVLPYIEQNR